MKKGTIFIILLFSIVKKNKIFKYDPKIIQITLNIVQTTLQTTLKCPKNLEIVSKKKNSEQKSGSQPQNLK